MKATTREGNTLRGDISRPLMGQALVSIELDLHDIEALCTFNADDIKAWMGVILTRFPPQVPQ